MKIILLFHRHKPCPFNFSGNIALGLKQRTKTLLRLRTAEVFTFEVARTKKMGRAKPDKQMVTPAKRDIGIFHIQQDLFENRIPAGRPENEGGFLLQQRYDKSKRCNIGREPQHRRHRNYGIPERTITPSKLPKQESAPRVSS